MGITEAIIALADPTGCSQPALEKYITTNYKRLAFKRHYLRSAIKRALAKGTLLVHHNHKNSYKLPAKSKKKAAPKKKAPAKKKATKKKATKKKKVTKKKKATKKKKVTKRK